MINRFRVSISLIGLIFMTLSSCGKDIVLTDNIIKDYIVLENVPLDELFTNNYPNFAYIHIEKIFDLENTTSRSVQAIDILGDELFSFHDTNDVIDVYDLKNNRLSQSIYLTPISSTHCNNASFSSYFYDEEDRYPLLYVMERGLLHRMLVFRLFNSEDILLAQKIQTIDLGTDTTAIAHVDKEDNKLYIQYYQLGEPSIRYLSRLPLPDISESDIKINIREAEETFMLNRSAMQDATIYNGFLFMLQGYSNTGQLRIVNLKNFSDLLLLYLPNYNLSAEPEGIAVYNNTLIVSFYDRTVYQFSFYKDISTGLTATPQVVSPRGFKFIDRYGQLLIINNGKIFNLNGYQLTFRR